MSFFLRSLFTPFHMAPTLTFCSTVFVCIGLIHLLLPVNALLAAPADEIPAINVQRFTANGDDSELQWTKVSAPNSQPISYGLIFNGINDALIFSDNTGAYIPVVGQVITTDIAATYRFRALQIFASVPLVLRAMNGVLKDESGISDISLGFKWSLLEDENKSNELKKDETAHTGDDRFGFALASGLYLPTSTLKTALHRDGLGGYIEAVSDFRYMGWLLAVNMGVHLASETPLENELTWGSGLYGRAALAKQISTNSSIDLEWNRDWVLGARGSHLEQPSEVLMGGSVLTHHKTIRLHAALGAGLNGGISAPTYRAILGIVYSPVPPPAPKKQVQPVAKPYASKSFAHKSLKKKKIVKRAAIKNATIKEEPVVIKPTIADIKLLHRKEINKKIESYSLLFDYGLTTISDAMVYKLDELADLFNKETKITEIQIVGHSDRSGTTKNNLLTSEWRAFRVRRYLISKGIAPANITAVGMGDANPVNSDHSRAARIANRRVVFYIKSWKAL